MAEGTEKTSGGLADFSGTVTFWTVFQRSAAFGAGAGTFGAGNQFFELDFFFKSERRLFKFNFQVNGDVRALPLLRSGLGSAAEKFPENVSEVKFLKVKTATAAETRRAIAALESAASFKSRPELVILRFFFFVGQHLIGLIYFFKLCFVSAGFVRMMLMGQFTVGLFKFLVGSAALNA